MFTFRALRNGVWPLLNILSQKEVQLCWPALGSSCLLSVFHPGIKQRLTVSYLTYRLCNGHPIFLVSVTPSLKYSQRGGKGEVVVTFGAVQGTRWVGRKAGAAVQVKLLGELEDSLQSSYKYMFQRLRDVRNGKSLHLCV